MIKLVFIPLTVTYTPMMDAEEKKGIIGHLKSDQESHLEELNALIKDGWTLLNQPVLLDGRMVTNRGQMLIYTLYRSDQALDVDQMFSSGRLAERTAEGSLS
jgi:hypothetical protein